MAETPFDRLKNRITREYRREGYSKTRARYIGRATAGEVARAKHAKRKRRDVVRKPPHRQTAAERRRNLLAARKARRR